MTAEQIDDRLNARRVGSGRWMGKCPGHDDKSPSLNIREGRDGRVLLNCFAGCPLTAILMSADLHLRDLFQGPPPSLAEARRLQEDRVARERVSQAQRQAARTARARYHRLQSVVDSLGAKLARRPDDAPDGDKMTQLFHETLSRLREAEQAVAA
jgi:hypothetical protein